MRKWLSLIIIALLMTVPSLCCSEQPAASEEITDLYAVRVLEPDQMGFGELILTDRYVFIHVFDMNSIYRVVDYTYEIVDGELKISFYHQIIENGRMMIHNDDWFVICVGKEEFDRLSVYGDTSNITLYENGEISSLVKHTIWYPDYHKDTQRYR